MKVYNIPVTVYNGKEYKTITLEIEATHSSFNNAILDLSELSTYSSNKVVPLKKFHYVLIPSTDNDLSDWPTVLYKSIMVSIGYSPNTIMNIMSNAINTKALKPNKNFTNSQTAFGLISSERDRILNKGIQK